MTVSRFNARSVWVAFVLVLLATAGRALAEAQAWARDDAANLLRRAGFGGTPGQIDALQAMGREEAVEYLLTGKMAEGGQPIFPAVTFPEFALTPVDTTIKADTDRK